MTLQQIAKDTCIVRNTAGKKGRTVSIVPGSAASRYLHHGRIILDEGDPAVRFDNEALETGLVCLNGSAPVKAAGQAFTMGRLDSLYVPRGESIEVTAGKGGCDLAEIGAPVDKKYPVQFVPIAEVQKDPTLRFNAGKETNQREVNVLIGESWPASPSAPPATGRRGRRTSTRRCSKKRTSTLTCRRRRSGCSWCTPTQKNRSWRRLSARATWC